MKHTKKRLPSERRLYPRVDHQLPVNVIANGYDFSTTTQNVSCIGTYCHIKKYVPPFTKISIKMVLPTGGIQLPAKERLINCEGVIVRTEDDKKGGFNVAIFFNEIKEQQRKKIARYLSRFLPQKS
ncbi:MAG: PilZ domain-containing protein [Candidatus Omnitrophica bacterium]|nr:PilZ domain-containing protein [Candidatus Omnitrophota bacterium]